MMHEPVTRLRPEGRDVTPPHTPMVTPRSATSTPALLSSQRSTLREWHAFTPAQRRGEWVTLVEWVIWLHDRYELAQESRIPECWTHHPGLIEELFALKAWREEIYTAAQPSAQAARYWHAELRQVVQAASSFYAKGCRAGHKASGRLVAANENLCATWLGADPLAGVPLQLLTTRAPIAGEATVMTDAQMRKAITRGDARPVGKLITEYQHYLNSWWVISADATGWEQVTDPIFMAELDAAAERMALADSLVEDSHQVADALPAHSAESASSARQGDEHR